MRVRDLGLLVLLASTVGALAAPAPERGAPPSPAEWLDVFDQLLQIDESIGEDRVDDARRVLESAVERWRQPFSDVALRYQAILDLTTPPRPSGALLFAEGIRRIEDDPLRTKLEERVLALRPIRHDACASVLLARGSRAFYAGDLDGARALFRRAASEHPRSRLHGMASFNVGIALRDLGRYDDAIVAFRRVLDLDVDNREWVAISIMEMGFRNYHYRAALNVSWCFEQLGRYPEAYEWTEKSRTTYPYEGWCGVEIDAQQRFLARTADRIAWKAGGGVAARRLASTIEAAWHAWAGWSVWLLLAIPACWKRPRWRPRLIHWTVVVALAVAAALVFENPHWLGYPLAWLTGLWPARWAVPAAGLVAALALHRIRPRAGRLVAAAALLVAAVAHVAWVLGFLADFPRSFPTLHELQLGLFIVLAVPAAMLASAVVSARRAPISS